VKESEIRNKETLNKYLELVEKDVRSFLKPEDFLEVRCPACGNGGWLFKFQKMGLKYVSCEKCRTLFVNPRPGNEALKEFYSKSPSTDFWINEFYKPVAEIRRKKIFVPRAEYIGSKLDSAKKYVIGDIGAGFGLFIEELKNIRPDNRYVAIEPSVEMANICRDKKIEVKCACLEEINGMDEKFDLLTSFELAEHLFEPLSFFKKVHSLLKPGGHFFLTTLNGLGFDILLLWDRSKSIAPHHLNFFNTASIRMLLESLGFEVTEISTPGRLDWDRVEEGITDGDAATGKFWQFLAEKGTQKSKNELQDWISKNNLSSHMQVVAKKNNFDKPTTKIGKV